MILPCTCFQCHVLELNKHTHPKVSILALFLALSLLLLSFIHPFLVQVLTAICFLPFGWSGGRSSYFRYVFFLTPAQCFSERDLEEQIFPLEREGKKQTGSEDSHFWPGISASVLLITWLIYREPSAWTHPGEHWG